MPMKLNPWMLIVRTVIASHIEIPTIPPRTPGAYAFEEPEYRRDILTRAGFDEIDITPWTSSMLVGGKNSTPDSATEFLLNVIGVAQRALEAPPHLQQTIRTQIRDHLQPYATPDGVRIPAATWLATAHA